MGQNVIIFTPGWSGSSVLAGLIARRGYWLGEKTAKVAYETFENAKLVELDEQILRASGHSWSRKNPYTPPIERVQGVVDRVRLDEFRAFLNECSKNEPWLWKDPRLCYTIFFWSTLIDLSGCKFILMTREAKQAWIGAVLRARGRLPLGRERMQVIIRDSAAAARRFTDSCAVSFHALTFEQLILNPEESLAGLNEFLGLDLGTQDLKAVYRGPLYEKRWSEFDYFKAHFKQLIRKCT